MELSPFDGALVGLASLGSDSHFRWPRTVVRAGCPDEEAARTFDLVILEELVQRGLAWRPSDPKGDSYAITAQGARYVTENVFLAERPPMETLESLLRAGCSVGLHAVEGGFQAVVMANGAAHIGKSSDLGKAINVAKVKVDKTIVGSEPK